MIFLKPVGDSNDNDDEVDVEESFIKATDDEYNMRVLKKSNKKSPYVDTSHVAGTSVIVVQLFSRCGIFMRPHRRLMDSSTLEMLVMLRFNRDLWGKEEIVRAIKGEPLPFSTGFTTTPLSAVTSVSSDSDKYWCQMPIAVLPTISYISS